MHHRSRATSGWTLLALGSCWALMAPRAHAWGPVAHYYITVEAAPQKGLPAEVAGYASLPDYDGSTHTFWIIPTGIVKASWCWSHGVQSNGTWDLFPPYKPKEPKTPATPDDPRYPGAVMKILVKDKLDLSAVGTTVLEDLQRTVNGFRAHNAADREVHFSLFRAPQQQDDAAIAWCDHHSLKETWADYEVFIEKAFSGSDTAAFSSSTGMINSPFTIPFKGNAKLMHLAQLVYIKNRRSTDARSAHTHYLDEQSVEAIAEKITDGEVAIATRNRLSSVPWFEYWATSDLAGVVQLKDASGNDVDKSNVNTHRREFDLLRRYLDYSVREFANDADSGNDWKVWDRVAMVSSYNASVQAAASWMYTTAELTP